MDQIVLFVFSLFSFHSASFNQARGETPHPKRGAQKRIALQRREGPRFAGFPCGFQESIV